MQAPPPRISLRPLAWIKLGMPTSRLTCGNSLALCRRVGKCGECVRKFARRRGLLADAHAADLGVRGPDTLVGTSKADTIRGFGGNDVLRGKRGADHLYGGPGNDRIRAGNDGKKDLAYGGRGRDRIVISFFDHAYAGAGNDTVVVKAEGTEAYCGPGHDTAIIPRPAADFIHLHSCEVVVKVS